MSDLGDVPDADRARLDEPEPAPVVAGSIIDLPFPAWMAEQQCVPWEDRELLEA